MRKAILLLTFLEINLSLIAQNETKTSTYFFIRHAEKVLNVKNPDLTKKGEKRALAWSKMLTHYKIDKVLSTNYKRTLQTAKPIANKYQLQTQIYHPYKFNVQEFIKKSKGENIVIVGHSNTIPNLVNKFIGKDKYNEIDETIYGNLYIVTITNKVIQDIILNIE
ncbi:histidine phosphatase family protein [uncultured Tenacibaculum sp.]|uniref:SixA phosphatase family protein n=1 Tax=uncultured Tenacibaculum sp. TaxID=174713 RepID=UPI0026159269|nr:phosphoglycerate mutase family protein [uncultured Tenacibaculum sp.]